MLLWLKKNSIKAIHSLITAFLQIYFVTSNTPLKLETYFLLITLLDIVEVIFYLCFLLLFSFAVVELIFFNELGTFSSVAVKGQGGAAIIECVCSRCNIKERYCSSKAAGGYLDITKRISSASFLCGGTPTSAVRFLSTINASHPSRNTITRCYSKIRNIVVTQTDAIMEAAQQEYLAKNGNKWIISLDFTWDSRNKGKFKVIIFDFIKIC